MRDEWTNLLFNPQAIKGLYEDLPSLRQVEISEVRLIDAGPTVQIHVHLTELPTIIPKRWANEPFNRVGLWFQLIGVESLEIRQWTLDLIGTIEMLRQDEKVRTSVSNSAGLILECLSHSVGVDSFSPYFVDT